LPATEADATDKTNIAENKADDKAGAAAGSTGIFLFSFCPLVFFVLKFFIII
jgi:hypothetical protein